MSYDRQCSSCGGFCGRGGCKRENVKVNKQREALELALEAIKNPLSFGAFRLEAICVAIREALAEPEKTNQCGEICERAKLCAVCAGGVSEQEPVAWMCADEDMTRKGYSRFSRNCEGEWNIPVYTTPPTSKPLTDEQLRKLARDAGIKLMNDEALALGYLPAAIKKFARAIERAHGIGEA